MDKSIKEVKDDGRTVADMNVEGMRWYQPPEQVENKKKLKRMNISVKEKRAMLAGSYLSALPALVCMLVGFGVVALLMWLWLKSTGV